MATIRSRYTFIVQLDAHERGRADCNERDLYEVNKALGSI